ncbi:MAG: alpha-amylase family glycosyl hydrolase, partial [Bacteroidota bacterium]
MSRSIMITIDAAADAVRKSDLCPIYELHINSISREKYKLEEPLFESTGNVVFPNFRAVRELAYQINKERGILGKSDQQIRAGKLNAIGLIDEINHYLVKYYNEIENPNAIQKALRFVHRTVGEAEVEKVLRTFAREFPPRAVYLERQTLDEYIESVIQNRAAREIVLEELIMLHLANLNPSFAAVKDLFDDSFLLASTAYQKITASLELFFQNEKPFGPDNDSLIGALKKPMLLHPDNIEAQLGYYKKQWGILLSAKYLEQIEKSFILTSEEDAFLWHAFNRGGGPPLRETFVPQYPKGIEGGKRISTRPEDYLYDEPERFTADTEWMPNVVLLAKNIHVWLDQLSKKYQRPIKRLQEIPDEELDRLAAWNFTGLWLIGVWERSHSSKMIKQINGNLDAVSSAYSLYDYEIAQDIGGEEAFQNLNHRARQRGIRLAGDMVPNHMGLYSKWVIEHPEYFIQSDRPPYPNYHFTGPNLSEDPNVEIRVEDGYWSKSDAAVVFQRIDKRYGDVRYLYHGNDGTSMPWNDTAQLNLLRADVREAVIQNIFHVARKFSIIRFDAAMTLAKKHFQRLWYPMPGTIGVPSRSDYGMSRPEFDAFFPVEFWREVVDRFKVEMPQTLLLAEAFWLMEGYFVRTLGMHRVYNSAFMHMLMKEENGKFAGLIKNTLEYNPEILKRYVNFMSNPDEETA